MLKKAALHPWHPAEYDQAVTGAIKALAAGNANDAQQKRALDWIVFTLCGQQIVKQTKLTTPERRGS